MGCQSLICRKILLVYSLSLSFRAVFLVMSSNNTVSGITCG